jgi:hypothetical protein
MRLVVVPASPLATIALMTVLERSPSSGGARRIDGARTRRDATPTDGEEAWGLSRGVWVVPGEAYPDEARLDGRMTRMRRSPFGRGSHVRIGGRQASATTADPITFTPWSARTSTREWRCARALMMKNLFSLTDMWSGLQESRREMSTQEDVERYSGCAHPGGMSSPLGWLAHTRR